MFESLRKFFSGETPEIPEKPIPNYRLTLEEIIDNAIRCQKNGFTERSVLERVQEKVKGTQYEEDVADLKREVMEHLKTWEALSLLKYDGSKRLYYFSNY